MRIEPNMQTETSPYHRGAALLGRNWHWILVRGLLVLLLAAIAFVFPVNAVFAFTMVFAVFAGVDGIVSLVSGVAGAAAKDDRWGAFVLRGVIGIAIALLFVLMPAVATLSYALVGISLLGAWAIIAGVLEIAAAVRLRKVIVDEWLLGASGLLSIILGFFVWVWMWRYPLTSLLSFGWMIGVWALLSGIALVSLALRLRALTR